MVPKTDDKARRILAAATSLFARYGYKRTSIDDIAREAEIAKGTIYLYFDSKEACFRGVCAAFLAQMLDEARAAAAGKGDLAERLEALLAAKFVAVFELVERSPHAKELLDSTSTVGGDLLKRGDRDYEAIVVGLLSRAERRGEIALAPADLTRAAAADFLIRGGHGLSAPDPEGVVPSPRVYRARLQELVRIFLRAVRKGNR